MAASAKDFNTGLLGGLFKLKHYERMGSAVWLYTWLVLRQTWQVDGIGLVLGGHLVSYREIQEATGFPRSSIEGWMHVSRGGDYIVTSTAPGEVVVRVSKPKKFPAPSENAQQICGGQTSKLRGRARELVVVAQSCGNDTTDLAQSSALRGRIDREIHKKQRGLRGHTQTILQNPPVEVRHIAMTGPAGNFDPAICSHRTGNHQLGRESSTTQSYRTEGHRSSTGWELTPREGWKFLQDEVLRRELYAGVGPEPRRGAPNSPSREDGEGGDASQEYRSADNSARPAPFRPRESAR